MTFPRPARRTTRVPEKRSLVDILTERSEKAERKAAILREDLERLEEYIDRDFDPVAFIESAPWRVAKTMPECPHEYTARGETPVVLFEAFVRYIRRHGKPARYGKHTYIYWQRGRWKYWTITGVPYYTRIINRARVGPKEGIPR